MLRHIFVVKPEFLAGEIEFVQAVVMQGLVDLVADPGIKLIQLEPVIKAAQIKIIPARAFIGRVGNGFVIEIGRASCRERV